jgi:hypothetical protein
VRVEVYTGFRWGYLTERDHLEDLGVDERIILKYDGRASTGLIWFRIGTNDRLL